MAVNAYINFRGNCREAVEFYADVFGTEQPKIMTYGEQDHGFPMPEETKNLVMHTELHIMGSTVMFSDVTNDMPFTVGNNISLTVTSDNAEALKTAFHKLKAGGQVIMELQKTFWSELYGFLTDKFGVGWQLSHETTKQAEDCPANPDANEVK